MSVILDALKKLEQERASSRAGQVDVVPEMVRPRRSRGGPGRWRLLALACGAVVVTVAVTVLVMVWIAPAGRLTGGVPPVGEAPRPAPPETVASRAALDVPGGAPRTTATETPPAVDGRATAGPTAREVRAAPPVPPPAGPAARDHGADGTGEASPPASPPQVSGIAWQEAREDRRAVVNGSLVGEGAVVAGARVVAIHQDRVRFSQGGVSFDVVVAGPSQSR